MGMNASGVRKTFKYKLRLTPQQGQAMEFVLRRCRELYNAALQERREAWQKCGVNVTCASQSAQLPAIKEVRPEYRDIHSQVLQDVLTRLDCAFQAFFRRVQAGEQPGYPRFQGTNRYSSFTYKQFGNGATLDKGFLVLSKIGRIGVRWSRPLEGTPRPSPSPTRRMAGTSAFPVLRCRYNPCHPPDARRVSMLG